MGCGQPISGGNDALRTVYRGLRTADRNCARKGDVGTAETPISQEPEPIPFPYVRGCRQALECGDLDEALRLRRELFELGPNPRGTWRYVTQATLELTAERAARGDEAVAFEAQEYVRILTKPRSRP